MARTEPPIPVTKALVTVTCTFVDTRDTGASPDAIPSWTPCTRPFTALVTGYSVVVVRRLREVALLEDVYKETSSATNCAVDFDPCRYPFLDKEDILVRAAAHCFFPLSVVTSWGANEASSEAVSVAKREEDLSWILAA